MLRGRHVAEHEEELTRVRLEEVVEIAADVFVSAGRLIDGSHLDVLEHGHLRGQESLLQAASDLPLPFEAVRVLDRHPALRSSFRLDASGQLRQTMLLADGQGVISQAPIEGLLHPTDELAALFRSGMAAALPFVDEFVEGHSLDSLQKLAEVIAR